MNNTQSYLLIIILTWSMLNCTFKEKNENKLSLNNLLCNYVKDPLALNDITSQLGWQLSSSDQRQTQIAYHILVSSTKEKNKNNIADLWDSGRINSDQSQHIIYKGKVLESKQRVFWKVRVWNQNNQPSEWSETNKWEIGLLIKDNWKADWIGISEDKNPDLAKTNSAPYFRKEFNINKKLKSAKVYVSGLGYYEYYLNG